MIQSGERRARGFGLAPSGDWKNDAACRGLADHYFDPWDSDDRAQQPDVNAADICKHCPVKRACLRDAIVNDEPYGTWGGLTRVQRKFLARARRRAKCPICHGRLLAEPENAHQLCMACGVSWKTRRI